MDLLRPSLIADKELLSSPCDRYIIRRAELRNIQVDAIVHPTDRYVTKSTAAPPGFEKQLLILMSAAYKLWVYDRGIQEHPNGLPVGEAMASPKFDLENCLHIIHTNGPSYKTRSTRRRAWLRQKLADCYRRCLEEALKTSSKSIAFPCIGTGNLLGWERMEAAKIGLETVRRWFNHPLFGKNRKEKIPGPIYFLSDPMGSYTHQEEAWWTAFGEIWPSLPAPPPRPTIQPRSRPLSRGGRPFQYYQQGRRGAMSVTPLSRNLPHRPLPGKGGRPYESDTSSDHSQDRKRRRL